MANGTLNNRSSPIRLILALFGGLLLLVVVALLCLPTFFSTSMGKNWLVRLAQSRLQISLNIQELSLSWFGGQQIQGLNATRAADQLELTAQEIKTDASLWGLILKSDLGNMQIASPSLRISKPFPVGFKKEAFPHTLQTASFCAVPQMQLALPTFKMPLKGNITIDEGKINLTPPGLDPILFDHLKVTLDLNSKDAMALNLIAKTSEQKVEGQITINASASNLQSTLPEIAMQTSVTDLPVRGLDQIFSLFSRNRAGLLLNMIGPSLNVQSQLNLSKGNFDLNLNASSSNLSAQIAAQSQNGSISLKNPAAINYTLTPDAIKLLATLMPDSPSLTLASPVSFQCQLSQFSLPFTDTFQGIESATYTLSLTSPAQMPLLIGKTPFSINGFSLQAVSAGGTGGTTLSAKGSLQSQGKSSPFAIDGKFNAQNPDGSTGSIAFNWLQMPTDFIAQFTASPHLTTLLGAQFDCTGSVAFIPNNPKFHFTLQSPMLSIPSIDFSLGDQLTLLNPCAFTYNVSRDILKGSGFQMNLDYGLQGTVNNCIVPVKQISLSRFDGTFAGGALNLSGTLPLAIAQLKASFSLNTFDNIAIQLDGDPIKATFKGAFKPATDQLLLLQPLFLQLSVDNPILKAVAPSAPQLAKPFILQCSVNPMTLNIANLSAKTLKASGNLSIPELNLTLPKQTVQILSAALPFQWDPQAKSAALEFSASVPNTTGQAGNLQGQISVANFTIDPTLQMNKALVNGSLDFQNISSSLIEVFLAKTLAPLIGDSFSGKLKVQSTPDKQNLSINWSSPYLNLNSTFAIDPKSIDLQGAKNQVNWTLTPEGYKTLDALLTGPTTGAIPFELQEKSTFAIQLDKLHLPLSPKTAVATLADRIPQIALNLGDLEAVATVRNPALNFFDKNSQEAIQLSQLALSVDKKDRKSPMTLTLDTSVLSKGAQAGKSGTLSLSGKILPSFDAQDAFDFSKLTSMASLKMQQFPSRVLDIIARTRGRTDFPFSTLFGDVINADANCDLREFSGPVNLNLNSRNTRLSLAGTLAGGALTLRDHIYAQLKITPEISRLALRQFNPLSLSYLYSVDPVTIEILADGFYMPLHPLQIEKTAIPEATIEMGKIICRNEGNVNVTLGLLKSKKVGKNSDLDLWFAPMDLHIQKGNIDVERTEVLIANTFDVALWGKVDLVKDWVDMMLGLTANTLQQAFGVKNLPENYVLTIPMRGKMDNVKIDTGKATAKVALLLAWQQAESVGGMAGGPAGAMVGGLLNKMAKLPDGDSKAPPAKHPFPWEVGGKKSKKATSQKTAEKKKHFKQNEKPLKQILKVIR